MAREPLRYNVPIVLPDGTPTEQFQRAWSQLPTSGGGGGGGSGTVTSVSGTGTVNGLTLGGTVTTSGNLTLSGSLSATSANITNFAEAVDDRVASLLVAGSNITLTYNDPANTLTIDAAGGTAEEAISWVI